MADKMLNPPPWYGAKALPPYEGFVIVTEGEETSSSPKKGRKTMTAAEKKAFAERMKRARAAKKKGGKKATAKKVAKKAAAKRAPAKKVRAKKAPAKRAPAKKASAKRAPAKKAPAKKAATKKTGTQRKVSDAELKSILSGGRATRGLKMTTGKAVQVGRGRYARKIQMWTCVGPTRTGCGPGARVLK